MTAHQVITGALNHGENVYAVGSVEGINFTVCSQFCLFGILINVPRLLFHVCAVGCDVVILASNFERAQIISGCQFGPSESVVTCVDCCMESGKVH